SSVARHPPRQTPWGTWVTAFHVKCFTIDFPLFYFPHFSFLLHSHLLLFSIYNSVILYRSSFPVHFPYKKATDFFSQLLIPLSFLFQLNNQQLYLTHLQLTHRYSYLLLLF